VRAYPVIMVERLEALTAACHQRIYRQSDLGLARLGRFFLVDFPARCGPSGGRAARGIVFVVPMLAVGVASYLDPGLHPLDPRRVVGRSATTACTARRQHRPAARKTATGRCSATTCATTSASPSSASPAASSSASAACSTWPFNGVLAGSIAGYLTWRGLGPNFYSFVVTHAAFELTAIVLAGAAG
jgi:hypothetical protein